MKAMLSLRVMLAALVVAAFFDSARALEPDSIAGVEGSLATLQMRMRQIQGDLDLWQRELRAANLASDPSARAASKREATKTLDILVRECSAAERIYGQLQGWLPPKLDASSSTLASGDLASIVADLGEAEKDLEQVRTTIANLR